MDGSRWVFHAPIGPACKSNWIKNSSEDPVDKQMIYTATSQSFSILGFDESTGTFHLSPTSARLQPGAKGGLKSGSSGAQVPVADLGAFSFVQGVPIVSGRVYGYVKPLPL